MAHDDKDKENKLKSLEGKGVVKTLKGKFEPHNKNNVEGTSRGHVKALADKIEHPGSKIEGAIKGTVKSRAQNIEHPKAVKESSEVGGIKALKKRFETIQPETDGTDTKNKYR
ncbi:MAG: hypothetical protein WCJ92_07895 [Alphaproteobacteria bacterium]